jgi:hypothetical protein
MKLLFYISILLYYSIPVRAQIEVSLLETAPLEADRLVNIDNLGNLYYLTDNALYKKSITETINYNNFQLGNVSSANAFNPLKINLFYKEFNTVIILDNRLSEMFKINFNEFHPLKNLSHTSTGNDNTIWLFDQNSQQLENFDYKANSVRVRSLPVQGEVLDLKSNYNFCWLLTERALYIYNYFGSLLSKIDNEGYSSIEEHNGNIYLLKDQSLFFMADGTTEIQPISLANLLIKQFLVTDESLYIYDGESLHRYQLKIN